jgi:hypothetical protein
MPFPESKKDYLQKNFEKPLLVVAKKQSKPCQKAGQNLL